VASLGSRATVWSMSGGRLLPVAIRLGLVDSANAELAGGALPDGASVATGVTMRTAASGSPLAPTPMRGPTR
jgi:hypothetical protein